MDLANLEPVAGVIDPGETPEDAARREAAEEARLTLGELLPVAEYYPSPGALAESQAIQCRYGTVRDVDGLVQVLPDPV